LRGLALTDVSARSHFWTPPFTGKLFQSNQRLEALKNSPPHAVAGRTVVQK
jgi:hypothetical protein